MRLLSYFSPVSGWVYVYMLQQVDYSSLLFVKWFGTFPNLFAVQKRQTLDYTARAKFLVLIASCIWFLCIFVVALCLLSGKYEYAVVLLMVSPFVTAIGLALSNVIIARLLIRPREAKEIAQAAERLSKLRAKRIAILGSYGKTTMKEILATVLSEGLKVEATPDNKNVLISHARWVASLESDNQDALIFEYGESLPGDIKQLTDFSHPGLAIITGLAPAHLDGYKNLDAIATDFSAIYHAVEPDDVYLNGESPELISRMTNGKQYKSSQLGDWRIQLMKSDVTGLTFDMTKGMRTLHLKSHLVGEHLLGSLGVAVVIADELGMKDKDIVAGVGATKPFQHRMSPYSIGGAWIIDDTYNGNFEGMRAGLKLLSALEAKRKIYVTPGLVEQGALTEKIHVALGLEISRTAPDVVVLMQNSTTEYILAGMEEGAYQGKVKIVANPLEFYQNLEHFVASGDLVLLQNDWTDNYL